MEIWNIFLFIWHYLPVEPMFLKQQERFWRWAVVFSIQSCSEWEWHQAVETCMLLQMTPICHIRTWLKTCYLLPGTLQQIIIIHKKLGVKKGCVEWVPCFLTGALKMETVRCARCLPFLNHKALPTNWCCHRRQVSMACPHSRQIVCGLMKPKTD